MAALKYFARSIINLNINLNSCNKNIKLLPLTVTQATKRWASFKTSPLYDENTKYTDYEVTTDPEEWKWVEHYLPPSRIPEAPKNVSEPFPSGWKAPREDAKKLPYFIARTRNHMIPVYLERTQRGMRRVTKISRITGDLIQLEADLREYLENIVGKNMGTQIIEPTGTIKFRGDVVSRIKEWMEAKGF
ncbi:probable 39S ribosomal protein L49, mitochondrial [Microplitis mediator]|uniref:probable 39S ribosomal protein L49, mitochondrial n=1 Tax=Microplitis mediator TaxID=375433 RepID=UPI002553CC0D|nr:probable 39S ribosomal protein L49, mitochondrial [Microplitis mediator]